MVFLTRYFDTYAAYFHLALTVFVVTNWFGGSRVSDRLSSLFVGLFAVVFLGMRDAHSGTDTSVYLDYFTRLQQQISTADFSFEPFFFLLTYIISLAFNQQGFLISLILFQLVLLFAAARALKLKSPAMILLSYISFLPGFDLMTNALRQGVAITLSFLFVVFALRSAKARIPLAGSLLLHKSLIPYSFLSLFNLKMSLPRKIRLSFTFVIIFWVVLLSWGLIESASVFEKLIVYGNLSIFGTSMTLGEKMGEYLTVEQDIFQGVLRYYFLVILYIPYFALFLFWRFLPLTKNENVINMFLITSFLAIPYAIAWISPFSFRYMYLAFVPGLFFFQAISDSCRNRYLDLFYSLALVGFSVLTYGSSAYTSFRHVV